MLTGVIEIFIIIWVVKTVVSREYRMARDGHQAQIARAHPDWHPRKVGRAASRRTLSHWLHELNAWPPFPSFRAAFAEDRKSVAVAAAEAKAARVARWKELDARLKKALDAAREDGAPGERVTEHGPCPGPDDGDAPALPADATPRLRAVPAPGPYAPLPGPGTDDSSWLEPHEERCEACGGTGSNDGGTDSCPVCRGWGSRPPEIGAPRHQPGTICRACGHPGTFNDPVISASQIHRSHVVENQARYQDALARQRDARSAPQDDPSSASAAPDDDPFPEPEDDNWPAGIPHRRNGDGRPTATEGNDEMPTGMIDTSLENADTPHEAMQGAFRQIGARAAEFAQAASDDLAAAAAVHGMDRDPQTMSDIAALADHAQALQAQADAAATGLASRHADGAEYHGSGTDAHASAFRPS